MLHLQKIVFYSRLGNLNHSHSRSLNGLYYQAWLECWCHYFATALSSKDLPFLWWLLLAVAYHFFLSELPYL